MGNVRSRKLQESRKMWKSAQLRKATEYEEKYLLEDPKAHTISFRKWKQIFGIKLGLAVQNLLLHVPYIRVFVSTTFELSFISAQLWSWCLRSRKQVNRSFIWLAQGI